MPANDYYDSTGAPSSNSVASSATMRSEFNLVEAGFTAAQAALALKAPSLLTGYVSAAGTVAATDTILQAIQKLNGNDATNANLTGHVTSTGNAAVLGSFTLAQLNTAISDADVATGGGTATGTNTGDQTNITGNAATVTTNANLTGDVTSVGNATTLTNAPVIAKVLTSYASAPGVISASDSILTAIQKLNGNNNRLVWTTKTTTYTAVAGDAIMANTTSAAFTITLPATPAANDVVRIADYAGTFGTNNLTIGRNSSKIMSLSEDMTVSVSNASFTLSYIDSTRGWALT